MHRADVGPTPRVPAPATDDLATAALAAVARDVMDRVRYMVIGTIDEDGGARTSPVYFVPHGYRDLYWVSDPTSHHSQNLARDARLSAVVFDSGVAPGPDQQAVYLVGTAEEVRPDDLADHLPKAFDPERGARAFDVVELRGEADLRLWVLRVERCEVHVAGGHPTLGTGTDRRVPVDPRG